MEQEDRRTSRARKLEIDELSVQLSVDDLEKRIKTAERDLVETRQTLAILFSRQAEERLRIHEVVDVVRELMAVCPNLTIYEEPHLKYKCYGPLSNYGPDKIDEEPFESWYGHGLIRLECIKSNLELRLSRFSLLERLNGESVKLRLLQENMPLLRVAVAKLRTESSYPLTESLEEQESYLALLREAHAKRRGLDEQLEAKRRTEERRRYQKARLDAIDELSRQSASGYRERIPFTGKCAYCESNVARGNNAHLDHIIPISKGGLNAEENLVWACDRCNLAKSDKALFRFCNERKLDYVAVVQRLHELGKFV